MAVCGLGLKCDGSVADDLTVGAAQRAADVLDFDVTQYHHRRFVAGREQLHLAAVATLITRDCRVQKIFQFQVKIHSIIHSGSLFKRFIYQCHIPCIDQISYCESIQCCALPIGTMTTLALSPACRWCLHRGTAPPTGSEPGCRFVD